MVLLNTFNIQFYLLFIGKSASSSTSSFFKEFSGIPSSHLGCTNLESVTGSTLSTNKCTLKCLQDNKCIGFTYQRVSNGGSE